jgi:hypothetical protein
LSRLRRRRTPAVAEETDATQTAEASSPALLVAAERARKRLREPRHVRAVPSSPEQRIAAAIAAFNGSEHPRTVAGVTRSLGLPSVSVSPASDRPSVVRLVVAWELCWYRYEVDLADEDSGVRVAGQGNELDELELHDREPNALCDQSGALALGA